MEPSVARAPLGVRADTGPRGSRTRGVQDAASAPVGACSNPALDDLAPRGQLLVPARTRHQVGARVELTEAVQLPLGLGVVISCRLATSWYPLVPGTKQAQLERSRKFRGSRALRARSRGAGYAPARTRSYPPVTRHRGRRGRVPTSDPAPQ